MLEPFHFVQFADWVFHGVLDHNLPVGVAREIESPDDMVASREERVGLGPASFGLGNHRFCQGYLQEGGSNVSETGTVKKSTILVRGIMPGRLFF